MFFIKLRGIPHTRRKGSLLLQKLYNSANLLYVAFTFFICKVVY